MGHQSDISDIRAHKGGVYLQAWNVSRYTCEYSRLEGIRNEKIRKYRLLDTPLEIGKDETPLSYTVNDTGKVVVQEDHVRGLLTDIRPRNVHGDAMGGELVVNPNEANTN